MKKKKLKHHNNIVQLYMCHPLFSVSSLSFLIAPKKNHFFSFNVETLFNKKKRHTIHTIDVYKKKQFKTVKKKLTRPGRFFFSLLIVVSHRERERDEEEERKKEIKVVAQQNERYEN